MSAAGRGGRRSPPRTRASARRARRTGPRAPAPPRARARAVIHFGVRRWRSAGSGTGMSGISDGGRRAKEERLLVPLNSLSSFALSIPSAMPDLCIEDIHKLARRVLAREPEEDLLEPLGAVLGA